MTRMTAWSPPHRAALQTRDPPNREVSTLIRASTNAAWRLQHKLMQAMLERDRRYQLGAAGPRIEIDDAYVGGERSGEGSGRGRRGYTPFIAAIETSDDGRPPHARLQGVRGFRAGETKRLCAGVAAGTTVVSDGGQWLRCIAQQPGVVHERHVTGSGRAAARHPAFRWANNVLANVKNSLVATHRAVGAKHLPRYLSAFAWRFNRRFVLKTIQERLAIAATITPPMPYRRLKLAEARIPTAPRGSARSRRVSYAAKLYDRCSYNRKKAASFLRQSYDRTPAGMIPNGVGNTRFIEKI
jgi:ISXO2-like transposase domain